MRRVPVVLLLLLVIEATHLLRDALAAGTSPPPTAPLAVAGNRDTTLRPASPTRRPIWLVVTRPMFTEEIKPLAEARRTDGFEAIVTTKPFPLALDGLKKKVAFILIVGDFHKGDETKPWFVATRMHRRHCWSSWQAKQFATDVPFGDVDGDGKPDVPVGRFPVRTADQLKLVVRKTLEYESRRPSLDSLRMPVWAGSPSFGPFIDSMATALLRQTIAMNSPAWVQSWSISAGPTQPLCAWPPDHADLYLKKAKEENLINALIGHGTTTSFHSMRHKGKSIDFTEAEARRSFSKGPACSPFVIINCSSGDFTHRQNSLAESLLFMPGGPPVVIAATEESHPLPNYYTGMHLLRTLGHTDRRIGTIWLKTQKRASVTSNFMMEQILKAVEGDRKDLDLVKLNADQLYLYAILGDPAVKLPLPERLEASFKQEGKTCNWSAPKPRGTSKLYVTFLPADRKMPRLEPLKDRKTALDRFEKANAAGEFSMVAELSCHAEWKGSISDPGILRLIAVTPNRLHVATFTVEKPEPEEPPAEKPE